MVKKCVQYSQPAIAITDYGNMFGVLDLYFKAKEQGIKPILGLEIYLSSGHRSEKTHKPSFSNFQVKNPSLVLLAQNKEGYRNLCHINTIAYQEGFYYVPRVDNETLKKYSHSLIALTGGLNGIVPQTFLKKGSDKALKIIRQLKDIYEDRLYLQLNRTGQEEWNHINTFLMDVSKITGVPFTVGNDVHYLNPSEHIVQDALFCIGTNRTLRDPDRLKLQSNQFYFKNSKEMRDLFKDIPKACDSTLEISSRCQVQFQLKRDGRAIYYLPKLFRSEVGNEQQADSLKLSAIMGTKEQDFGVKKGEEQKSPKQQLRDLSLKGLSNRWREWVGREKIINEEEKKRYRERLEEELRIITGMGFADYFLIVYDFIHWAKKKVFRWGLGVVREPALWWHIVWK